MVWCLYFGEAGLWFGFTLLGLWICALIFVGLRVLGACFDVCFRLFCGGGVWFVCGVCLGILV